MQEGDIEPGPGSSEGPVILVVGILGLFMQALGPVAWVWGNSALKRAKPSEAGLIQAGRILGMIDTIILVLGVVLGITWYIAMASVFHKMDKDLLPPSFPAPASSHAPSPAPKSPANGKTHPVSSQ